ncbi:MAG: glycosyltransferase family 9 protein [Candidatus Methylomirabilales bacterium]
MAKARTVLVVLVAGIGDWVMATPAIRSIRRGFRDARIVLLTTPESADLARPCPHLDEVLTFDLRTYRPEERGSGLPGLHALVTLAAELRARRFDLAINLYRIATLGGAVRMGILLALLRAKQNAGRWSHGLGAYFAIRGPDVSHQVDAMAALASALGCPPDTDPPELWVPEANRRGAATLLPPSGDPFLIFNAGSNRPSACLPGGRAMEIGRELRSALGLPILWTGGGGEREKIAAMCEGVGSGCRNLAGRTGLLELAAILGSASAVVSTDTGPMHMAAAMGAPLVALFGPASPIHSGPRGRGRIVVLQGQARPRDPLRWHQDISSADVVRGVCEVLSCDTQRAGRG